MGRCDASWRFRELRGGCKTLCGILGGAKLIGGCRMGCRSYKSSPWRNIERIGRPVGSDRWEMVALRGG
jgi:hypothetical protein